MEISLSKTTYTQGWLANCDCDGSGNADNSLYTINGEHVMISQYKLDRLMVIDSLATTLSLSTGCTFFPRVMYVNNSEVIAWVIYSEENTESQIVNINGDSHIAIVKDVMKHFLF